MRGFVDDVLLDEGLVLQVKLDSVGCSRLINYRKAFDLEVIDNYETSDQSE